MSVDKELYESLPGTLAHREKPSEPLTAAHSHRRCTAGSPAGSAVGQIKTDISHDSRTLLFLPDMSVSLHASGQDRTYFF